MSLVGIFSKSRPSINGLFFDALLEESSEMITDVTEYPLESGAIGNDHAVTRPLRLTMTVALSDNPIKAMLASESIPDGWAGVASKAGPLVGIAAGAAIGALGGAAAAGAGLAGSVLSRYAPGLVGSGELRSSGVLKTIREIQSANSFITVVGAKEAYDNVMITNTRVQITKQNEGGLELVVEMRRLLVMDNEANQAIVAANLPPGDTASTQAQPGVNIGEVGLQ